MFNTSMNKWLWTSTEKFPYAYNLNDQNWVYFHFEGTKAWFFDYGDEAWNLIELPQPRRDGSRDERFLEIAEVSRFLKMATRLRLQQTNRLRQKC